MASIQGIPRKRITTYGKVSRKRMQEYSFKPESQKSHTPDVQAESESRLSPTPPPISIKSNTTQQRARSKTPLIPPPADRDIFDVPSSDEDMPRKPTKSAPKPGLKMKINKVTKQTSISESSYTKKAPIESRKRTKLSPSSEVQPEPITAKTTISQSSPIKSTILSTKLVPKVMHRLPGKGQISTIAARPKPKVTQAELRAPQTPLKLSPQGHAVLSSTPSPPSLNDVDMMDVDPDSNYISPRGLQMWKGLLDSTKPSEEQPANDSPDQVQRPKKIVPIATQRIQAVIDQKSRITKRPQNSRIQAPRRRLIDSLVEQAAYDDSSDSNTSEEDANDEMIDACPSLSPFNAITDISRSASVVPDPQNPPTTTSASQGSQSMGPKITYSRTRSMLVEEDFMKQLAMDLPSQPVQAPQGRKARRGSIPTLQPLPSFHEDDDDADGSGAGVRSVHELRQAGANSRFLDEIEDFLDRIGNPMDGKTSMRRSGLLELASKLKDKGFARQFRANSVEQRLFLHLGQETDIISGFLLISVLLAVLIDGNVPPVMVQQLRRQGIARLLIRLLEFQAGIVMVAKDRKNNMSKITQTLMSNHHDNLLKLPVWEELEPQILSPRTTALKCLELMVRQTRQAGNASDIFSKELTTKLFSILNSASEERAWALPEDSLAIDFYLALSALESHSITARTVHDENIWITDYLPIVADSLDISLQKPVEGFGKQQTLILRLTLNVTNNNPKASDVFARGSLMSSVGQAIVAEFRTISRFMTEEDFSVAFEHLILVLGVMINFAEWSLAARESFHEVAGGNNGPLDNMIQTFMDGQERTSMAESVVETHKNVAFGYLSVLLGYLALLPAISDRVREREPRKTLRPLLASIEEFIVHHKTVDSQIEEDEDGHNPQSGLTERLESLVNKLGTS
ncbi:wings apart-like protein regulation of heterochromatin-domain-containing protein [Tricladium varicosporioides]|nr:wings apart-like protein regulation of heterochromatin-domain-containing protein [Hymenoscyphus varicosporioides]